MGRRPHLRPVHDIVQTQPSHTPCSGCGYPLYDADSSCPGCGASQVDKPVQPRNDKGQFSPNVRLVTEPPPRGAMNLLNSAVENLQWSAVAYRTHGDWIMRDAMLADIELITKAVHSLIYEKEGLK